MNGVTVSNRSDFVFIYYVSRFVVEFLFNYNVYTWLDFH